jgi:hypothetical protein
MLKHKRFKYAWTNASARLRKKAKQKGWPSINYYDNGYRCGYLKARGPKWSQVVILAWRKIKVGEELDALTGKTISIYKSKYDSTAKRILNTFVK